MLALDGATKERLETIKKAAAKQLDRFSFRNKYASYEDAFVLGAIWADDNPIDTAWHKTEDELPIGEGVVLISTTDSRFYDDESSMDTQLLTAFLMFGNYPDDNTPTHFQTVTGDDIEISDVTHWMRIPR